MQISLLGLADIATEAAGRDVAVRFFNGYYDGERVEGVASHSEIRLASHGWAQRGDKCFTYLHELGHVLLGHPGKVDSERAEREADQFAQAVIARAGQAWFAHSLRGCMLSYEYDTVLGAIAGVLREMQPTTPTATRAAVAGPEIRAKLDTHQALLAKLRAEGRATPKLETALGRTIGGLRGLLSGQETRAEDRPVEYAVFNAAVTVK